MKSMIKPNAMHYVLKVKIQCECLKSLTHIFKTCQVLFLKHDLNIDKT